MFKLDRAGLELLIISLIIAGIDVAGIGIAAKLLLSHFGGGGP